MKTKTRNKKQGLLTVFILLSLFFGSIAIAQNGTPAEIPDEQQIEEEIKAFQHFFKERFPIVPFETFNQGVYALPQFYRFKVNRDLLSIIPPYEHDMMEARSQWNKKASGQQSLSECMEQYPGAQTFPYFSGKTVLTIERAINQCFKSILAIPPKYGSDALSMLVATYREQYKDVPLNIDYSEPRMRAIYKKGRDLFWSRRGQNNFSCAACHIHNAGNQMRNTVLSAALGQAALLPVYSPRLAKEGKNWVNLHDQYARCYLRSGAAPLPQQSKDYIALEVYQAIMDSGIPLNAPGFSSLILVN